MTNSDADQLYDRPTVMQLIQTDRRCADLWGYMDLGGYRFMGTCIHGGMDVWWVYGHLGSVQTYGGIRTLGCMDLWGCTDLWGIHSGIQMYGKCKWGIHRYGGI